MAYEKLLNEIYAAVSLKYLWAEYRPVFVKSESPDWVNETLDLGLEVSQALQPDDGQMESFIEKYLGCRKEELPVSALERYGDRLHFYNGRFWAILPGENSNQNCMSKAKYRFHKKLDKLNTNYVHYRQNGLYLFLHPGEKDVVDAEELFTYMKEQQALCATRFDWIFLNCADVIYVCNYQADALETIVLPQNAASFLNTETERLRHTGEWPNGASIER